MLAKLNCDQLRGPCNEIVSIYLENQGKDFKQRNDIIIFAYLNNIEMKVCPSQINKYLSDSGSSYKEILYGWDKMEGHDKDRDMNLEVVKVIQVSKWERIMGLDLRQRDQLGIMM